ncbi:hypothetical protein, unknown function [Leishmania mexicana MHOM/GT/2001/U1103]|uniref:Surface antigen protein 2 n=1 Tax=Leishmania mexicana (strain MHOM/GT/2001/U1103) TaxID=929439 RepID=E9B1U5_LEIMU|nr:hypothetical protein, unknown function [Leishmania mexicana MHOM/GT/2001/U1103]CBZ29202.1 hypothetical protein, unknown function [Leishmania mexicana MHOM/GT/2001/U1103]
MLRRLACAFLTAALGILVVLLGSDAPVAHAAVDMPFSVQAEKAVLGIAEPRYSFTSAQKVNTLKVLQAFADAIPSLGWTGTDFCKWSSVTCYQSTVILTVSGISVEGTLPDFPDDVDYSNVMITAIYLFDQKSSISGTLPSSWGKLQYLVTLNVGSTSVSGTLPASWGSLQAVTFISLQSTSISGSLPALWSSMSSLATLILYDTQLSGTLPPEWSSMASMNILQLHQNQFTGSFPESWAQMPALRRLSAIANNFCGCVPDSWKRASFRVTVDPKNSAADCATANPCVPTTTTTAAPTTTTTAAPTTTTTAAPTTTTTAAPTTTTTAAPTTTTTAAPTTTTTAAPTTTTTEAPSECEVPHCITCVRGNPTRCDVCSSGYMVTAAQWCMKRPSANWASSPSSTAFNAAASLGVLAAVLLSM